MLTHSAVKSTPEVCARTGESSAWLWACQAAQRSTWTLALLSAGRSLPPSPTPGFGPHT